MSKSSTLEEIEIDGCHLSFKKSGQGFPIVLIHVWHPYAKFLLGATHGKNQIITFDTPGYYSSPSGKLIADLDALINILNKFFDRLGYKKIDLIGQCLGGIVAMKFAADYPKKVKKLVIITPPLIYYQKRLNKLVKSTFIVFKKVDLLTRLVGCLFRNRFLKAIADWRGGYGSLLDPFAKEADLASQRGGDLKVLVGILSDAFGLDIFKVAGKIKAKTLFIAGNDDPLQQSQGLEKLAKSMQKASFVSIPGATHSLLIKKTPPVNEIIVDFLRD